MPFELANSLTKHHLIVQPRDSALNPPEVYFYVQDGLIIACGVLYALYYFFYAVRTARDAHLAGPVEFLSLTLAYELFYAHTTTSTPLEFWCFILWFICDLAFVSVALLTAYPPKRWLRVLGRMMVEVLVGVALLRWLASIFPDERDQATAFWAGVVLQFPISIGSLLLLVSERHTKGHSLEIWVTRCLGCWTAYGLFFWRWWNVPQNWEYVANPWSVGLIGATLFAEAVYPGVYVWVWRLEKAAQVNKEKRS